MSTKAVPILQSFRYRFTHRSRSKPTPESAATTQNVNGRTAEYLAVETDDALFDAGLNSGANLDTDTFYNLKTM